MLPFADVNLFTVSGATVAAMIIGSLYYGPLFGKPWMKLVGLTQKDASQGIAKTMVIGLLNSFLMIYILGLMLVMLSPANMTEAIQIGLALWFGFTFMNEASSAIWARGPWKLVWINAGYTLILNVVSVLILTHWA